MAKLFKQVSTGLILKCEREDVIEQYEKYPDQYIRIVKTAKPTKAKKAK